MNTEEVKSDLTPDSVAMCIERRTKINGSERAQNVALIEALIKQEIRKRTIANDEQCDSSPLEGIVRCLTIPKKQKIAELATKKRDEELRELKTTKGSFSPADVRIVLEALLDLNT